VNGTTLELTRRCARFVRWDNSEGYPDPQITKMKGGRTHQAPKAEHAVDLETRAVPAVTLYAATGRDTNTLSKKH
jgi:hypothetical protein